MPFDTMEARISYSQLCIVVNGGLLHMQSEVKRYIFLTCYDNIVIVIKTREQCFLYFVLVFNFLFY